MSKIPDPLVELTNQYYRELKDLRDAGEDIELFFLAKKEADEALNQRSDNLKRNLEFSVNSSNTTSQTAVTQLIIATSVGIALVANAVDKFKSHSAIAVAIGIVFLIVSIIIGWLELNSDKQFFVKNVKHFKWSIDTLFSLKFISFSEFDRKEKRHRNKAGLRKDETETIFYYAQPVLVVAGFVSILIGLIIYWGQAK